MSNTTTKNLLLSQLKLGKAETYFPTVLPHTSTQNEHGTEHRVEIPGIDPSTVEVTVDENSLVVKCGEGELTIPIAVGVDTSKIKADILWGLLTIVIPAPAQPVAHSIKVGIHDTIKKAPAKFTSED